MWIWQLQPLILLIISLLSVCISRSNAFICNHCNRRKMSLDYHPAVDGWEDKYIEQGGDKEGKSGPKILSSSFDVHAASDTEQIGKRYMQYCNVHMMCTFI